MSVDVTNPDAMPVRVRPRPRGGQSANSFQAPPTLLRVPDIRPTASVGDSEAGTSRIESVVPAAQYEALAVNLGEACMETTMPAHDLDTMNLAVDGLPESEAKSDNSTLAKLTGKTIDAVSRIAQKWTNQLGTFGAIAVAVIACMLVALAMKQDGSVPELRTNAERADAGAPADPTDIEVTNLDAHDDRLASKRTANADMSHFNQETVNVDDSYAHSPPISGAFGPTQDYHHPSAQRRAVSEFTPSRDSTRSGPATRVVDTYASDTRHWGSPPTFPAEPHSRFSLNQTPPQSPFDPAAISNTSEPVPNVSSVERSVVWPKQGLPDDARTEIQRSTPYAPLYQHNALAGSPRSPNSYPITDQSLYGSFDDLKTALIQRKLERNRELRLGDSRPLMPTRNPDDAAGNLGMDPTYLRGGAYR